MRKIMLNVAAAVVGIAGVKTQKVQAQETIAAVTNFANVKNLSLVDMIAEQNHAIACNELGQCNGPGFYKAVLKELGANETPEKIKFLDAWRRGEGGTAKNNPFNTTKDVPGESDTKYNSVGVRNYPDPLTGLKATVATLKLHYYKDIVSLLKRDDVKAFQIAACKSLHTWGTGYNVLKVLGISVPSAKNVSLAMGRARRSAKNVALALGKKSRSAKAIAANKKNRRSTKAVAMAKPKSRSKVVAASKVRKTGNEA